MYRFIGDFHTHSCVSQHAYSTIGELADAAARKGFSAFAVTDHGPALFDGASEHHFLCMNTLPDEMEGVRFLRGVEADIMDYEGGVDISKKLLSSMDFIIASYHAECITPESKAAHTKGWIRLIESRFVDCLGHCGNPMFDFDHRPVLEACRDHEVAIEINENSFAVRPGSEENCRDILSIALELGVHVIVNSDAHSKWALGCFPRTEAFLEKLGVPEERILSCNASAFFSFIERRKALRRNI